MGNITTYIFLSLQHSYVKCTLFTFSDVKYSAYMYIVLMFRLSETIFLLPDRNIIQEILVLKILIFFHGCHFAKKGKMTKVMKN